MRTVLRCYTPSPLRDASPFQGGGDQPEHGYPTGSSKNLFHLQVVFLTAYQKRGLPFRSDEKNGTRPQPLLDFALPH